MTATRNTALVIGASGGIGGALFRQLQSHPDYERVIGTYRTQAHVDQQSGDLLPLDLADEQSITSFVQTLECELSASRLTSVCICTGLLHAQDMQPERRMAALNAHDFERSMRVNALGPLLLVQQLMRLLPRKGLSRLLVMSARVGSIADNRLGGWLSYRSAKAALNQGFKTLAIELRRTHPDCVVSVFHPGTVDTALSKPFQSAVPSHQLFSPQRAAEQLSDVLHARTDPAAHLFIDWAGRPIEY